MGNVPSGEQSKSEGAPKPAPVPKAVSHSQKNISGHAYSKLPDIQPQPMCLLRMYNLEDANAYLSVAKQFIDFHENDKKSARTPNELNRLAELRGSPMDVGTLEELFEHQHAIISTSVTPDNFVSVMSFVDQSALETGATVLLNHKTQAVVGLLPSDSDPMVNSMKVDKAPNVTYADVGGLNSQIQEIKETVELPLTRPELYDEIGVLPPKGVCLHGPPGTGKTLLAKAVARETGATFFSVMGSELVQKYAGEGIRIVKELFSRARRYAPSIIFIDEIDSVATKRFSTTSGGEKEVQRTVIELLNQLDGFDSRGDVKIIFATNRIETLDPALIRPGRIDRKVEFPMPNEATRRRIFEITTQNMTLDDDVNLEVFIRSKDEVSGADIKAIASEAGMLALRDRRMKIRQADLVAGKASVMKTKLRDIPAGMFI